jgi:hypothetical protein
MGYDRRGGVQSLAMVSIVLLAAFSRSIRCLDGSRSTCILAARICRRPYFNVSGANMPVQRGPGRKDSMWPMRIDAEWLGKHIV